MMTVRANHIYFTHLSPELSPRSKLVVLCSIIENVLSVCFLGGRLGDLTVRGRERKGFR